MEGERGCSSSVVPKFTEQCREYSEEEGWGGGHERPTEEVSGLCHHMCVCVLLQSHPLLHLSLFRSQAHATDYIMRPHPCAAVEENKGALPAERQQPRHTRRGHGVCLCAQKGRERYAFVCLFYSHINDHVNALGIRQRNRCVFLAEKAAWYFSKHRGSRSFPQSHGYHGAALQFPPAKAYVTANPI